MKADQKRLGELVIWVCLFLVCLVFSISLMIADGKDTQNTAVLPKSMEDVESERVENVPAESMKNVSLESIEDVLPEHEGESTERAEDNAYPKDEQKTGLQEISTDQDADEDAVSGVVGLDEE